MLATVSCAITLCGLAALPQDKPGTAARSDPKATTNPLIATVGKAEIRLADLIDEVNRLIPLTSYHRRVPPEQMEEINNQALDKLTVKHLIHLDALDAGLQATEEEVQKEFAAALIKAGPHYANMPPKQKTKLLKEVRPTVVKRVLISKNERRQQESVPKVNEAMVRQIYDERIKEDPTAFMSQREAHLLHIFVKLDPARIRLDGAEKKAKIEAALKEIKAGKSFAEVARLYSEGEFAAKGGDLGFQKEGTFRMKTLNEYAFKLDKGTTSEVIRSLHGYHLLHCVDIKPPSRLSFEEMKPVMTEWLNKEHAQGARGRWLHALRKKYPVKVLRPELLEVKKRKPKGDPASKGTATSKPTSKPAKDK